MPSCNLHTTNIPPIEANKPDIICAYTTIFVEEDLHRLVELHYKIGLIDESKKYAALLGYNYQSSQWYENSYAIFDKKYKKREKTKLKKEIPSLFFVLIHF